MNINESDNSFLNHHFGDKNELSAYLKGIAITVGLIAGPIIFSCAHSGAFPSSVNALIKKIAAIESLSAFGAAIVSSFVFLTHLHIQEKKELQTALGRAIDKEDIVTAKTLLHRGADLKYFSPKGKTVFDLLKLESNEPLEQKFLKEVIQEKTGYFEKQWKIKHQIVD